jgi:hypothetical protein
MRAIAATLLFCLVAVDTAFSAGAQDSDVSSLAIDAGRLVVMVDQSEDALKLLAPAARVADPGHESARADHVFPELVDAVQRYDMIVEEACRLDVAGTGLCAHPFRPVWLADAPDAEHGEMALRGMIDDATAHLEPFWSYMCKKAKPLSTDEAFCQLE